MPQTLVAAWALTEQFPVQIEWVGVAEWRAQGQVSMVPGSTMLTYMLHIREAEVLRTVFSEVAHRDRLSLPLEHQEGKKYGELWVRRRRCQL